jgi:hypothetical protein
MILYHATNGKKAKKYHDSGCIRCPVRGFDTLQGAMAWAMKVGRTVIYEIKTEIAPVYKLPDHHNQFGNAWWVDADVPIDQIKCVFSATKDA